MAIVNVRATYEFDGWGVVVVTGEEDAATRVHVFRVNGELHLDSRELWAVILAAARPSGICLPATPGVSPTSPGAGVREWTLPAGA